MITDEIRNHRDALHSAAAQGEIFKLVPLPSFPNLCHQNHFTHGGQTECRSATGDIWRVKSFWGKLRGWRVKLFHHPVLLLLHFVVDPCSLVVQETDTNVVCRAQGTETSTLLERRDIICVLISSPYEILIRGGCAPLTCLNVVVLCLILKLQLSRRSSSLGGKCVALCLLSYVCSLYHVWKQAVFIPELLFFCWVHRVQYVWLLQLKSSFCL